MASKEERDRRGKSKEKCFRLLAPNDSRVLEAVALLNGLRPELLDNDRCLLFHLRQQHLIELIREGSTEEAFCYPQDHLSDCGEEIPQVLSELERTLALLAFEEPQSSPFRDLLHPSQRQKVASEVNATLLEDQNAMRPQMYVMLRLLLWAQGQLESLPRGVPRFSYPRVTQTGRPRVLSIPEVVVPETTRSCPGEEQFQAAFQFRFQPQDLIATTDAISWQDFEPWSFRKWQEEKQGSNAGHAAENQADLLLTLKVQYSPTQPSEPLPPYTGTPNELLDEEFIYMK
ncbi:uncharacterized protein LOC142559834 [Dermacentor variabilis]|uniref:uncharacterized protein LOC142559834 n=1 Tax=Dermacentor variabilis TaxID=34621 RepID=UPI003F5CA365